MFSNTKPLLIVTAVVELGMGASLLVAPSLTAELLLGAGLESPESVLVGRVGGAALLAIGLSCWLERKRDRRGPPVGLVVGLAAYNAAAVALLIHAAVVAGMNGVGIWPACSLHSALLVWCVACLRAVRGKDAQGRSSTAG